jgi:nucleotide-binding universal stress UspA family protein
MLVLQACRIAGKRGAHMTAQFEILLASDFSARSDRPLDRALQLARERGGRVVIAHVLDKENRDTDVATLERLRADLPPDARQAELVIRTGSAPKVLATIAAERGSDLVVTGVARYDSLGDFVLGTTVDHMVRNAEAPVLVVRRRTLGRYAQLVVATDLSDCSRDALLAAARIFPDTPISLIHAFHVPFEGWLKSDDMKRHMRAEAEQGLADFLAHPAITPIRARIDAVAEEGDIGTIVTGCLRTSDAALLVLGTHGRSGFAHATIGSHAKALLEAADTDVLMVRERKA